MKMKVKRKKEKWVIKNDRPEEYLGEPSIYYTEEEVEKYARSGGMRRAQEKIAYRVLELLNIEKEISILDLGSGPGYTAEIYQKEGHSITCLDVIPQMIKKAKGKKLESFVGDMRNLKKIFLTKKFDAVVSVSALQWIKDKKEVEKVAKGIHFVLKNDKQVVIQFYPKSEEELDTTAKVFAQNGFSVKIITDWPEIPKNRTFYLVMKKK